VDFGGDRATSTDPRNSRDSRGLDVQLPGRFRPDRVGTMIAPLGYGVERSP